MEQVGWSTAEPTVRHGFQMRQQLLGGPDEGVDDGQLGVQRAVVGGQIGHDLVGDAERAGRGVHDQRQLPPAVQPQAASTMRLAITALPALVALGVPDRGAAGPGHVRRDPHRPARPPRHRDHRLGQRRPLVPGGLAEDAVHARRVVDRGRARASRVAGSGGPPRPGICGSHSGTRSGRTALRAARVSDAGSRSPIRSAAATASRAAFSTALKLPGGLRGRPLLARRVPPVPEVLHQRAGVDAHRAGELAGRVAGAGVHRVIAVRVQQLGGDRGAGRLAHHLAAQHDPLAGRGGQVLAGAGRFAEAALDARVGDRPRSRGMVFSPRRCAFGSRSSRTRGARTPCGSTSALDPPHQLRCPRAPFELQERGDVAAGGVLRLQRAVEALDGQPAELVHEGGVARHVRGLRGVEGEQEVQIAVRGVAGDGRVEAVPRLELEQGLAGVREPVTAAPRSPR